MTEELTQIAFIINLVLAGLLIISILIIVAAFKNKYEKRVIIVYYALQIYSFIYNFFSVLVMMVAIDHNFTEFIFQYGIITVCVNIALLWLTFFCKNENKKIFEENYSNIPAALLNVICIVASIVIMIYVIPDSNLSQIILTITVTLFGSFLTLFSVSWTNKKQDDRRRDEEIAKNTPYFNIEDSASKPYMILIEERINLDFEHIRGFYLKNVEDINYIPIGYLLNDNYTRFVINKIALSNTTLAIGDIALSGELRSFYIVIKNLKGNYFQYEITIENEECKDRKINSNTLDITYVKNGRFNKIAHSIGLPEHITKVSTLRKIKGYTPDYVLKAEKKLAKIEKKENKIKKKKEK